MNLILGFSQNSELIVLSKNDTLKSSDFDFLIKTKDHFIKFNDSHKLLYDNLLVENNDIVSLLLIHKNDTLNFKLTKRQFWTFEKENSEFLKIIDERERELRELENTISDKLC